MDTEPSWVQNAGRTALDWVVALALTGAAFWMLSWWRTPDMPDRAPDWNLETIEGEDIALSEYRGKTVVLNFWATWCGPCKMEIPEFRKFVDKHPEIPVLGIAVDGSINQLRQFSKQNQMNYPILKGDRTVQELYNVNTLPMTVVVGPDGSIEDVHVGIMLATQLEWATGG